MIWGVEEVAAIERRYKFAGMTREGILGHAFFRHGPARWGTVWIAVLTCVALAGPWIRPDATRHANDQHLELSLLSPGTTAVDAEGVSHKFLLGTDRYGRDFLSRLMAGSAISLGVGFVAVLISLLIGVTLGAWAGYSGGRVDAVISWFIQVVWTLPTLLMVLAITLAFGKGFWQVFVAIGLTMWVDVARVVRGQFISLREAEFVEAARGLGLHRSRIIFRHMLPNAAGPIIVIAASNFAAAILIEAGLSFLGVGAQIPIPSWGNIVQEHYALITGEHAWLAIAPGLLIMSVVLAFTMIGDGLRAANSSTT
jgi:ABC-type dipeptide/oligopeptide/nickel transport system permease subunit